MTRLPATGREGDPPVWPLSRANKRETELWGRLWRSPQAVVWERLGWTDVVARYARLLVEANGRDASASVLAEVRQLEDRLGLTPMSMLKLRWEVGEVEEEPEEAESGVIDIRERIKAVE